MPTLVNIVSVIFQSVRFQRSNVPKLILSSVTLGVHSSSLVALTMINGHLEGDEERDMQTVNLLQLSFAKKRNWEGALTKQTTRGCSNIQINLLSFKNTLLAQIRKSNFYALCGMLSLSL